MRAYDVLADIREARGDRRDAELFRSIVKAIRLSEEADSYYSAGLLKRAVSKYEESLKQFADAYCIQSRLAVQLAELGLHDQAEVHYRRAYELMPESFGRVESHCFGCERAFDGSRAQSVAEKVFIELAVKQPGKPQVHYLLGYLRAEQDRHAEALPHLKTAVSLDPEYLNAWEKLLQTSRHVRIPVQERDNVVFNLLRLDPMQRHVSVPVRQVRDLRGLWKAVEIARTRQPTRPTSLYTLSASKAALERQQAAGNRGAVPQRYPRSFTDDATQAPGSAIAETAIVEAALKLLDYFSFEDL
jgi:tetratricopeptide (TPR) repeat protein